MSLGEKIKGLRKSRGMSQEELAEQINVSRQAISKWELDASLPDIDNIVQLSRLFAISTDYLLLEKDKATVTGEAMIRGEMPRDKEATEPGEELRQEGAFGQAESAIQKEAARQDEAIRWKEVAGESGRQSRMQVICIGLCVIGLLFSVTVWFTWQTLITVMLGVLLQVGAIVIFELSMSQSSREQRRGQRQQFYSLAPWLILPFPVKFGVDYLFNYYPKSHNSWFEVAVMIIIYLLVCAVITYLLQRKAKPDEE